MRISTEKRAKKCMNCNKKFTAEDIKQFSNARFCHPSCHANYVKLKRNISRNNLKQKLIPGSGTVGAANELIVCADLLCRGKGVFRSMSPHCECDLVWMSPRSKLVRVEVTTGGKTAKGVITFPAKEILKSDLLAVVIPESQEIFYIDMRQNMPLVPVPFEIPDTFSLHF